MHERTCTTEMSKSRVQPLWNFKDWGARLRKYTEIIEDYGGVTNRCQLSLLAKEWHVG